MKNIFEEVAKRYGVTAEEVENQIKSGIKKGMANTDPKIQKIWKRIAHDGKEPTPEELIRYLAQKVRDNEPL